MVLDKSRDLEGGAQGILLGSSKSIPLPAKAALLRPETAKESH